MRALIVDDEPTVCLLLSRILARDFDCEPTRSTTAGKRSPCWRMSVTTSCCSTC